MSLAFLNVIIAVAIHVHSSKQPDTFPASIIYDTIASRFLYT